jgi:hypothetical protein
VLISASQCRVNGSVETPFNANYSRTCDGTERQTRRNGYVPEAQLQFVSDAVFAFGYALRVSLVIQVANEN